MRDERRETRDEKQETRDERRESERIKYISKPPEPKLKIHELHRKEQYSMYLTIPRES